MTEEPKPVEEESVASEQQEQPAVDDKAVRSHPLFRKVTSKQKEELSELKSRLSELEAERQQQQERLQVAKAEEEGRLKELFEEQKSAMAREVEELRQTLNQEREFNSFCRTAAEEGVVKAPYQKLLFGEYQHYRNGEEDPEAAKSYKDWLSEVKESETYPELFATAASKGPVGAGIAGRASPRGSSKEAILERLKDPTDAEAFELARQMHARGEL